MIPETSKCCWPRRHGRTRRTSSSSAETPETLDKCRPMPTEEQKLRRPHENKKEVPPDRLGCRQEPPDDIHLPAEALRSLSALLPRPSKSQAGKQMGQSTSARSSFPSTRATRGLCTFAKSGPAPLLRHLSADDAAEAFGVRSMQKANSSR